MGQNFPKPCFLYETIKFELDLSNYATKAHLKKAAGVDTLLFAETFDLATLKSEADKLDVS